jgi:hypothetical protein
VICVDWEAGALIPNYVRAAANTRLVGKQLSMLLEGLNRHLGLPFHNVHVIGFSLGAHVAGFAGAELKNLSRITGKYGEVFRVVVEAINVSQYRTASILMF